jgi:hypothetical protein
VKECGNDAFFIADPEPTITSLGTMGGQISPTIDNIGRYEKAVQEDVGRLLGRLLVTVPNSVLFTGMISGVSDKTVTWCSLIDQQIIHGFHSAMVLLRFVH